MTLLLCGGLFAWPACSSEDDDDSGGGTASDDGSGDGGSDDGASDDGGSDGGSGDDGSDGGSDDGSGDDGSDDGGSDDGGTSDGGTTGGTVYGVSGGAGRTSGTCPDAYGSIGTLCVSLRTDCADAGTTVSSTEVADADMTGPLEMPFDPVAFELPGATDGTYQLFGFLDKDATGCDAGPNTGDLALAAGCIEVVIAGADVTDADLAFDTIVQ
jgi:hypothetical protein